MTAPVRETDRDAPGGRRYAIVAGGGTAGHLQPALAIAEALVARGHDRASIGFLGSERGQDAATLAGRGFPVTLLPGRGIVRSLAPRDLVRNVRSVGELVVAALRAVRVVGRARPRVVVAVGGYASLAGAVGALAHRVPLVLVNVDAVPGAANRLFGRFARASAVGWEGTPLPRAVVTGTPVRPEIASVDRSPAGRAAARRQLGLSEGRTVVVAFGGSLGARRINRAVDGVAERWAAREDLALYHIVGRRDWDEYRDDRDRGADADRRLELVRVPYEERMDAVYAAADVAVCRAGAMTVAELAVAGVPAVLVPLPGAPGDHQTANARVLERVGAAVVLADPDCTPAGLGAILEGLVAGPGRLGAMGRAARSVGRSDAADAGARLVEASARPADGGRGSGGGSGEAA
ncbi:MAG TPA: UDP-N-acetylglucosamine--N-acetylmuramyl-(pentapeptide) pyrophosphoryl-undecaprenol N-acetylglucosamine transferase [Acidimicrobiales bacterium]|nr:UDP-N-acetylglucosamine--N-acetylmuramyl-(pentapeptide) pyrophosphoryl-undecaprenol N-acetylglucosamine transferase [Acidimicrobiales bacterium]